jgi:hypothetical protein
MTSRDFCIWLKGVVVASHHFNLTPKAWECVRAELELVNDDINQVSETKIIPVTPSWLGRDITINPYYVNTPGTGDPRPRFVTPTTTSIVSKKEQLND